MKTTLLIIILSIGFNFSFGSVISSSHYEDTTVNPKEYKLTKKEFLEKRGRDDSSKALINFYFQRRNKRKVGPVIGAAMALVSGAAVFPVKNMPDDNYYDNGYDFFPTQRDVYTLGIIVLAITATPFVLVGGGILMHYSRKRLLGLLNDYFDGKSIPKGISKNIIFRGYLTYGEFNHNISKLIKSTDAYKRKKLREGKLIIE